MKSQQNMYSVNNLRDLTFRNQDFQTLLQNSSQQEAEKQNREMISQIRKTSKTPFPFYQAPTQNFTNEQRVQTPFFTEKQSVSYETSPFGKKPKQSNSNIELYQVNQNSNINPASNFQNTQQKLRKIVPKIHNYKKQNKNSSNLNFMTTIQQDFQNSNKYKNKNTKESDTFDNIPEFKKPYDVHEQPQNDKFYNPFCQMKTQTQKISSSQLKRQNNSCIQQLRSGIVDKQNFNIQQKDQSTARQIFKITKKRKIQKEGTKQIPNSGRVCLDDKSDELHQQNQKIKLPQAVKQHINIKQNSSFNQVFSQENIQFNDKQISYIQPQKKNNLSQLSEHKVIKMPKIIQTKDFCQEIKNLKKKMKKLNSSKVSSNFKIQISRNENLRQYDDLSKEL